MTKQEYIDKVVNSYPLNTYKGEGLRELVRLMEVVYDEGYQNGVKDTTAEYVKQISTMFK